MQKNRALFWGVTCLVAANLAGCASTAIPKIKQGTLIGADNQFKISTVGTNRLLAPAPWQLEHFSKSDYGDDQQRQFSASERVKLRWPSRNNEEVDVWWKGWEVELSHRNSNGVIRVGVFPWHPDVPLRNLRIMAENIANDVSGSKLSVGWGALYGQRVASKIVSGEQILVGGKSAYRVTFDVVNLDQREHDPNSPVTRIDLVLSVATVFVDLDDPPSYFKVRGMLMLIHSNDLTSYEKTEPDFVDLMDRVSISPPKQ